MLRCTFSGQDGHCKQPLALSVHSVRWFPPSFVPWALVEVFSWFRRRTSYFLRQRRLSIPVLVHILGYDSCWTAKALRTQRDIFGTDFTDYADFLLVLFSSWKKDSGSEHTKPLRATTASSCLPFSWYRGNGGRSCRAYTACGGNDDFTEFRFLVRYPGN